MVLTRFHGFELPPEIAGLDLDPLTYAFWVTFQLGSKRFTTAT